MKSGFRPFCQVQGKTFSLFWHGKGKFHSSAPLHCAVTADAGLPLFTRERAGAAGSFGVSAAALKQLTCTARPDGSGARSGRLQPPGCERTAP